MLQTDPMKRATAEDIHRHEWFLKDLATYLFPDRDIDVAVLDHEALETVCEKFSVQPKEVEEILEEGDYQNPLAIAYRLIIDNKRIEGEHAMEEFKYVKDLSAILIENLVAQIICWNTSTNSKQIAFVYINIL